MRLYHNTILKCAVLHFLYHSPFRTTSWSSVLHTMALKEIPIWCQTCFEDGKTGGQFKWQIFFQTYEFLGICFSSSFKILQLWTGKIWVQIPVGNKSLYSGAGDQYCTGEQIREECQHHLWLGKMFWRIKKVWQFRNEKETIPLDRVMGEAPLRRWPLCQDQRSCKGPEVGEGWVWLRAHTRHEELVTNRRWDQGSWQGPDFIGSCREIRFYSKRIGLDWFGFKLSLWRLN